MGWIILGLVFLVVTYLSLKGTVIEEYSGKNKVDEHHVPMWTLLVAGFLYIIPIMGIVVFIIYNIAFIAYATKKPHRCWSRTILKLSDKNRLHRILTNVINFLAKDI